MLRLLGGLVLALSLAGCGTGGLAEEESASGGQELFRQKCGTCHALAAAGTLGNPAIRAPDLDAAFAASRAEGFDETTIREVVLSQMRFPIPPMPQPDDPAMFPSTEFSDEERSAAMSAIASYVASVAGNEEAIAQARANAGGASADDPEGLFTANCASCHTLAAAGTSGTIGPNLDESQADLAAITEQIRNGGGGMPAFAGQLTDEQIDALAAYVAENRRG
jgi:cbb3-type cytochrome c oxidase subunit III